MPNWKQSSLSVGASLLAIAVGQSTLFLAVSPSSRASSLPQGSVLALTDPGDANTWAQAFFPPGHSGPCYPRHSRQ
ncbi:hypothetical protein PSJE_19345 [Pseudomonas jessenii]|nr:hypothetical protein PSJE_19345 [Pseudomonas jessenii]